MRKIHVLLSFILFVSVLIVLLEFLGFQDISIYVKALVVPSICVFYISLYKMRFRYFSIFLILFSIADLLTFIDGFLPEDYEYYIGNSLYIMSYLLLIYTVLRRMDLREIVTRFKYTILILLVLNAYVLYVLANENFMLEFTVFEPIEISDFVGSTSATNEIPLAESLGSIILEFVYNTVILVLLSVSFINFLYRDNNRSLFLFIGSLCIVFSEVIQYAIIYPSEEEIILNIVCYVLLVSGFTYFYLFAIQSDIDTLESIPVNN